LNKKGDVTFLGVGDIVTDLERPETAFRHVSDALHSGDIVYANCDQALSDKGSPNPKQATPSRPQNIPALLSAGFNIISLANNHTQDWGKEALLDTMSRMKAAGLPYVGVGKNLMDARQPVILEQKGTKIGFLAYCCVGPEGLSYEAQYDFPGFAPLRAITFYEHVDPQPGTWPRTVTFAVKEDLQNMVEDIQKLRSQVDVVIVCPHWGLHVLPKVIPDYCYELGHAAVDAGADLIIGTHAHLLKGIEIFKGKVIFHSTGDFVFTMSKDRIERNPQLKYTTPRHVSDLKKLYQVDLEKWDLAKKNTLIARAVIEEGEIKRVSYLPCYTNDQQEPEVVTRSDQRGQRVFDYVAEATRSENLGTEFTWDGDEVLIWQKKDQRD
jgi:poly-gamma-glutamate capsule biosynthesis protein CapA/YwtB (metallophosphatase superfamily)